jgi:hypothetical protein
MAEDHPSFRNYNRETAEKVLKFYPSFVYMYRLSSIQGNVVLSFQSGSEFVHFLISIINDSPGETRYSTNGVTESPEFQTLNDLATELATVRGERLKSIDDYEKELAAIAANSEESAKMSDEAYDFANGRAIYKALLQSQSVECSASEVEYKSILTIAFLCGFRREEIKKITIS